jgi:hypothetical protein
MSNYVALSREALMHQPESQKETNAFSSVAEEAKK